VKSADLQPLFERAKKMTQGLESFRIDHVYREQNREADALANEALDAAEGLFPAHPGEEKRSPQRQTRVDRRQAGASPDPRAFSRRSSLSSGRC